MAQPFYSLSPLHRWSRLLAGFAGVLIALVLVASVVGPTSRPKPAASTTGPTATATPSVDTVVQVGLLCAHEATIERTDRGTLLICAVAKDTRLRWRRV